MKSNYKLGDLTVQRREKYSSGNLPICGVSKDGIIPPKQKDADLSIYNVLYRNDFMFNPARMELNSIALNDKYEKAICSSLYEIFYVIDYDILLPDYLAMILASENFRRFCSFVGSGSVREYCRYANIKDYPLILPSIGQQQKIVRQYKTIADRIALKQKINDNLVQICKTKFAELFLSREEYHNLNSSWYERNLGSMLSRVSMGPFGSNIKTDCFIDFGVPVLNGNNLTTMIMNENSFRFVSESKAMDLKNSIVTQKDIVVTHRGTLGQISMVPYRTKFARYVISQSQFMFSCDESKILPEYVLFYFHTDGGKRQLLANNNTTGVPSIAKPTSYIKELHIPVPPISLQKQWSPLVNKSIYTITENNTEIEALQNFSSILLSMLSR